MTLRTPFMILAALALAACTSNPFLDDGDAGGLNGAGSLGAGGIVPGSPSDPTSPAYFQQTIGDRVLFSVDESTLNSVAINTLNAQAEFLLSNAEYTALIEGHADEQGTREYNLALGARRAASVRDYLVTRGVADSRLRTVSYGKERPAELCSSESCYSQNRRSVTVLGAAGLGS
jgi:peptidoglycan-associated lipoprotein